MAGAGKKTFTAGETLTASDVNTYLMEQSVMVFGGTAARSSAIPTPSEGMFAVRTDTDQLDYYNGSAWVPAVQIGAWTSYTPTLSGMSLGNGTLDFKFCQIGKVVHVKGQITFGSTSTMTTTLDIGVPVNWSVYNLGHTLGNVTMTNNSSYFQGMMISVGNVSAFRAVVGNAAGTYVGVTDTSATVPFTWANTHKIFVTFTYEAG